VGGGALKEEGEEARGGRGGGTAREVGDDLTGGPHLSVAAWEKERGRVGEWAAWAGEEMGRWDFVGRCEKKERRGEGKGGPRVRREGGPRGWADRVCFVFFPFFPFLFKSIFKPISNLLNSNLLHVFKFKF
jgi:hypothetical protein